MQAFLALMAPHVAFLPDQVPPVMRSARGDAGVLDQKIARHVSLLSCKNFISLPTLPVSTLGAGQSLEG